MLDLQPGTLLAINAAPAVSIDTLLGGDAEITGFGFYVSLPSIGGFSTWRFDTINLVGDLVPETGMIALISLGVLGLILRRKRRIT